MCALKRETSFGTSILTTLLRALDLDLACFKASLASGARPYTSLRSYNQKRGFTKQDSGIVLFLSSTQQTNRISPTFSSKNRGVK